MPPKTSSPTRRPQPAAAPPTLHPTVVAVVYLLYHLPSVRIAVWGCESAPTATKATPASELQPHKFVRVLQQVFLKIQRGEAWSAADMQWGQKIVNIPGHVCFDICRNYMVGQLLTAIPELDDLLSFNCDHVHEYPNIQAGEVREAPDIPLTFGTPAHDNVLRELTDAGQMGNGNLQQSKVCEEMAADIRDKFAELGVSTGDPCVRLTRVRYHRDQFPTVFILDRWTLHPCVPTKTKRGDMMCARLSPHPQLRPPLEVDMAPIFPWPVSPDAMRPLLYSLHSVTALKGYEWAENFSDGVEVQGNMITSMGVFAVYINDNMTGDWLEVCGRQVRSLSWTEVGTILLAPNTMVTSYVYVARDRIPDLFPPQSTVEVPRVLLGKVCANPACGATAPEGSSYARCSRCHSVGYCQPECQRAHWKVHKTVCASTECLDDVYVPADPPVTIRPPFGLHCHVCIPVMVKREHDWMAKQTWEQLIQIATATKTPLPKSKAKLQALTPLELADLITDQTHPGVLRKKKKEIKSADAEDVPEDGGDGVTAPEAEAADGTTAAATADGAEDPDSGPDLEEEEEEDEAPAVRAKMPAARVVPAPESAMQSYALPLIVAMFAILVAFTWFS